MQKLVLVGHACLDEVIIDEKRFPLKVGGAVSYGASAASILGLRPILVSKVGPDFLNDYIKFLERYADLSGLEYSKMNSTRFGLFYEKGQRKVRLLSRCEDISSAQLTKFIDDNTVVHYGLLIREVSKENIEAHHGSLSSLDLQGYMRKADDVGNVYIEPRPLPEVDVIHGELNEAMRLANAMSVRDTILYFEKRSGMSLITLNNGGSFIIFNHNSYYVPPATPEKVVDETGAGDAFTIAFILEYMREKEPSWAAAVATSVASYLIETEGVCINASENDIRKRAEKVYNRIVPF